MYIFKVTIMAACLLPAVWAKCFNRKGDQPFWMPEEEDVEVVVDTLEDVCKELARVEYVDDKPRLACRNNRQKDVKNEFVFQKRVRGPLSLSIAECQKVLKAEVVGCSQGGKNEDTFFWWMADPNRGQCPPSTTSSLSAPTTAPTRVAAPLGLGPG